MGMDTLLQERERILRERETPKGTVCRCCGQYAKLYRRKFNSGMAYALILIFKHTFKNSPPGGWIKITHVLAKEYGVNANAVEYSKLKLWNLIEPKLSDDRDVKDSGLWRITEKGVLFVRRAISIPKKVYLYNNEISGYSDESTGIDEALGDHFKYSELMS